VREQATIRRAGTADLEALVRLAVAFRDHRAERKGPSEADYRAAYTALLVDRTSDFLIAEGAGGAPEGFLLARYRPCSEGAGVECEIQDLFVVAEAQRRGIGRRLVARAVELASERGAVAVTLTTNERNAVALALYESEGFGAESERWEGARQLWLKRDLASDPTPSGETLLAIDHVQLAMPPGAEAEARAFYVGVLGLGEVAKPAELAARGGCWFERGSVRVHLGVEPEFHAARKAHPAFRVADVPALVDRARAAGFAATDPEVRGNERRAYLDDAFGNRIEVVDLV
jgi:ribosomal protein S18 acetylase RimI-like enzyme/catechol 2,3-dioxygenase-like lactoylglutathione lyase family enzyme